MRADFVANASHELRTPLASVLGFVETLQGPAKNDAAARDRFLGIIAEQARRMTRLINDLLSLSRLEMRAHIPPSETVDLASLVPHLFDLLGGLAAERKVTLSTDLPEGGEFNVTGDRDELVRLIENLIENAIKYGGAGGKVHVSLAQRGGDVAMEVRDFGPGIPLSTCRASRNGSTASTPRKAASRAAPALASRSASISSRAIAGASSFLPRRGGLAVTVLLPAYKAV